MTKSEKKSQIFTNIGYMLGGSAAVAFTNLADTTDNYAWSIGSMLVMISLFSHLLYNVIACEKMK